MRRLRRVSAAAAGLAVALLAFPPGVSADDVLAAECDVIVEGARSGNTLAITTLSSFCRTADGAGSLDITGSVTAVVGWTCAGGVASGDVSLTFTRGTTTFSAEQVRLTVTSVAGAGAVALHKSADGKTVAGGGPVAELFTGPLACIFDRDTITWTGSLGLLMAEE